MDTGNPLRLERHKDRHWQSERASRVRFHTRYGSQTLLGLLCDSSHQRQTWCDVLKSNRTLREEAGGEDGCQGGALCRQAVAAQSCGRRLSPEKVALHGGKNGSAYCRADAAENRCSPQLSTKS
jgi:hypothetical protein